MLKFFFLVVIILFNSVALSQTDDFNFDSIKDVYTLQETDSLRMEVLGMAMKGRGAAICDEILSFGRKDLKRRGDVQLAKFLVYAGQIYIEHGRYPESKKLLIESLDLAMGLGENRIAARALINLAHINFMKSEFSEAKLLMKRCLQLIDEDDFAIRQDAFFQIANLHRSAGDLDSAAFTFKEGIRLSTENGSAVTSNFYSSYGRVLRQQGKTDSAHIQFLKALSIATQESNMTSLSGILNNLGNIHHIQGNLDSALFYYLKSLKIKEELGLKKGICISYHNVGSIMFDMKDWLAALEEFERSNKIAKVIDYTSVEIYNLDKMAQCNRELGNFSLAEKMHNEALFLSDSTDFAYGTLLALIGLGTDHRALKNYELSYKFLTKAKELAKTSGRKSMVSKVMSQISTTIFESRHEGRNENWSHVVTDKAILEDLLEAKVYADETKDFSSQLRILENLSWIYEELGRDKEQASVLKNLIGLKDSIYGNDRIEAVTEFETKYKTAQQEKEIIQLESENKLEQLKRRQLKIIFTLVGLISLLIGFFAWRTLSHKNSRRLVAQRERFRSELSRDLHDDVGSILTGVAMQTELLQDFVPEGIRHKVHDIRNLSREAMERMRDTVWAIDSRKDYISDVCDRMLDFAESNLSHRDVEIEFKAEGSKLNEKIEPKKKQNIYYTFKEMVSNFMKHSNGNRIEVVFSNLSDRYIIDYKDNGTDLSINADHSGLGLSNIRSRCEDENGSLEIDLDSGFQMRAIFMK